MAAAFTVAAMVMGPDTATAEATVFAATFQAAISTAVADGAAVKARTVVADGTVAADRTEDGMVADMAAVEDSKAAVAVTAATAKDAALLAERRCQT